MFTQLRSNLKFLSSVVFALTFLVGGFFITNKSSATDPTTWTVNPACIDIIGGPSDTPDEICDDVNTFKTIQAAIDAANPAGDDIINVVAGTYTESQILIDKPLTLQSDDGYETTTIDGGGIVTGGLIKITASSGTVTLSGFTIQNTEDGDDHGHGVYVNNAGVNVKILNNAIKNVGPVGILVNTATSVQIEGNIISSLYSSTAVIPNGIQIGYPDGVGIKGTIKNNTISDCYWRDGDVATGDYETGNEGGAGILIMDATADLEISDNNIHDNDVGIDIEAGASTKIENNDIHNNVYGVVLWNLNPSINNNKIENNSTAGIYEAADGTFSGTVDATNNWWGDATGPKNTTTNPSASGNSVSDNITYTPWLDGPTGTARSSNVSIEGSTNYNSIQAAIAAAAVDGDTINIAPGTYVEVGQIIIDKNLTIVGAGKTATIIQPTADTGNGNSGNAKGWFVINSGKTLTLKDLALDGNGYKVYQGIRTLGTVIADGVAFSNIVYPGYQGFGVAIAGGTAENQILNSTFSNIGREGVLVYGSGTDATISGNTYTGKDDGDWLDYAFEVGAGATATIKNNDISNNKGIALSDDSTSAGILVTTYTGSGTTATITDNTISDSTDGIAVGYCSAFGVPSGCTVADSSTVVVYSNKFSGNTHAINSTHPDVNAENNWYDSLNPNFETLIIGPVDFTPWYANAGMTSLTDGTTATTTDATYTSTTEGQADMPDGATEVVLTDGTVLDLSEATTSMTSDDVTIRGNTVTLTQEVILQSGIEGDPIILTNSDLDNVTVSIPDGTTIQGPEEWQGTITPPTSETPSGTAPAGFSVGDTVIFVGSSQGTLVFDKPVTLLLAGVTGTVGYKPALSNTWQTINNVCGGSYDAPDAPTAPGECAISNGINTKIVTFHFTEFGGFDIVHGSSGSIAKPATPAVPANVEAGDGCAAGNKFSTTTGRNCNAATPAIGKVLGAEKFNFTKVMKNSSKGSEVIELQNFLNTLGDTLVVDGKFGPKTKGAVIKFQLANSLKGDGIVGALTRAVLNK